MQSLVEYLTEVKGRFGPIDSRPETTTKDPEEVLNMCLEQFRRANLVVRVRSRLLGEDILLISDSRFHAEAEPDIVTYTADELAVLSDLTPSHIKRVHRLKKLCDGRILLPGEERL